MNPIALLFILALAQGHTAPSIAGIWIDSENPGHAINIEQDHGIAGGTVVTRYTNNDTPVWFAWISRWNGRNLQTETIHSSGAGVVRSGLFRLWLITPDKIYCEWESGNTSGYLTAIRYKPVLPPE